MSVRRFLPVLVLLALLAGHANAGQGGRPAVRESNAAGFRFLVFETAGAAPGAALPMIVGLHYSGGTPEAMRAYFDAVDFPARIVLPQGAHPRRDGDSWFGPDYARLGEERQAAETFEVERELSAFIGSVVASYPTRGKPVVMGISYGGDLAFLLAVRHPDRLRAAFPVAARFLPAWMPASSPCRSAGCPPIRAMHGERDTTVPMAPTREAVDRLRRLGFDVALQAYPGVAHDFDARMQQDFIREAGRLLAPEPGIASGRAAGTDHQILTRASGDR